MPVCFGNNRFGQVTCHQIWVQFWHPQKAIGRFVQCGRRLWQCDVPDYPERNCHSPGRRGMSLAGHCHTCAAALCAGCHDLHVPVLFLIGTRQMMRDCRVLQVRTTVANFCHVYMRGQPSKPRSRKSGLFYPTRAISQMSKPSALYPVGVAAVAAPAPKGWAFTEASGTPTRSCESIRPFGWFDVHSGSRV